MTKQILINAFYMASPAQAWTGLWAHPRAQGDRYADLDYWIQLARTAEEGLIDGIFLADTLGVSDVYEGKADAIMRAGGMFPSNDPMMLIPAMAAATTHLCFGVTANTTYEPPYLLARRLSTLDHLTKGRISWNVVTGTICVNRRRNAHHSSMPLALRGRAWTLPDGMRRQHSRQPTIRPQPSG